MIRKLLIANRGEIARRIMRTCREMGIETVAVFSDADEGAAHTAEASEAIKLPGRSLAATYLNADALIAAARRAGADAVHPGYGFLSENPGFAAACQSAGLLWVGPEPNIIARMGSKREARQLVSAAGVPVVPGYDGADQSDKRLIAEAARIGYPVLVKASAGGGGKGMRLINQPEGAPAELAAARRESRAAFGDATLFLERAIPDPRHIEFQIFGDQHGALIHLGERECSIQRRRQKIIEESPAPGLTPALRARMAESALAIGRLLHYTNAGTVEFIVSPNDDDFFLEVNTRLQVEHPVTELVTGLDLVRWQIEIAEGKPLPLAQEQINWTGHAIEARLYAEDPESGFLPSVGSLRVWRAPDGARCDAGMQSGTRVELEFDPLIAKICSHADTREAAARRLASALESTVALGVRTNATYLARALRHPAFLAGDTSTAFVERFADTLLKPTGAASRSETVTTAALLLALARRPESGDGLRQRWRNNPVQPIIERYDALERSGGGQGEGLSLTVSLRPEAHGAYMASCEGGADAPPSLARVVRRDSGGLIVADIGGRLVNGYVAQGDGHLWWIHLAGETHALIWRSPLPVPDMASANAGSLTAPMPGVIVAMLVSPGERVRQGQPLVTLEAMKMEHTVRAPRHGIVTKAPYAPGDRVAAGAALLNLADEESD
ncbi:MAG TPA: biotin carboxylase N-terminal domain-containing protein [Ktedonobacterales bacterium]